MINMEEKNWYLCVSLMNTATDYLHICVYVYWPLLCLL